MLGNSEIVVKDREERRLSKVKIAIMRNPKYALWSGLMTVGKSSVVDDADTRTASTNGRDEKYGREFVKTLDDKELAFVKSQDPNRIWTYCDGDNTGTYIFQGMRIVNRIGYFVTAVPFDGSKDYQIQISSDDIYECSNCGEMWEDEEAVLHYDKFEDLDKCAKCVTVEELRELEEMETHDANLRN